MEEVRNAKITRTMLGIEDHGIMTCMLYLDYGIESQAAGGYYLDINKSYPYYTMDRIGTAAGMSLIMKILEVVGVSKWEDLKGKHIRVKSTNMGVSSIGSLLQDNWLNFEKFFKEFKNIKGE